MADIVRTHIDRLKTAVLKAHSAASIARWVIENTKIGGLAYSYLDHEYQEAILSDISKEVNVQKCSQVGVSEVSARWSLGMTNVLTPFTVAYTLPTAKFAATFMNTRVDPVITSSEVMRSNLSRTNNNSEVKQFGESFLYLRGAASSNAPISIPCDALVHDELDFCDQEVIGQYISRLTHSKWKLIRRFSTPTLPNFGINKAFRESRRHFNLCKCNHCNHWFMPDYYTHVRVPGFSGDLREVNKQSLTRIRYNEAYVACPACNLRVDLSARHREYVCENPDDNYVGAGYQVTPFDAPNIIEVGYLIEASTKYDRPQDFVNFALGLPMDDREATLTRDDFEGVFVHDDSRSGMAVMGIDVGNIYHFAIGIVGNSGEIHVVHTEQVPMGVARQRYHELRRKYNVACTVIDSGPHAETVMALQNEDENLYASVYMRSKSVITHTVVNRDEEEAEGMDFQRQVNVNRSKAFDAYMEFIRAGNLSVKTSEMQELIIQHHLSMKRVKVFENESQEMSYSWQKSDGIDHFHHTFLYLFIASKIKGVGRPTIILPVSMGFKFRLKRK